MSLRSYINEIKQNSSSEFMNKGELVYRAAELDSEIKKESDPTRKQRLNNELGEILARIDEIEITEGSKKENKNNIPKDRNFR